MVHLKFVSSGFSEHRKRIGCISPWNQSEIHLMRTTTFRQFRDHPWGVEEVSTTWFGNLSQSLIGLWYEGARILELSFHAEMRRLSDPPTQGIKWTDFKCLAWVLVFLPEGLYRWKWLRIMLKWQLEWWLFTATISIIEKSLRCCFQSLMRTRVEQQLGF